MRTGSRTRFLIVRIEDWVEFTRRRQLSLSSSQVAKLPSCQAVKRAQKAYGRDWFFFHALHLFHSNNSQPVKQTPTKRRKIALNASIVRLLRSLLSCSPALSQILVKLKKLMARLKNKGRCWLLFARHHADTRAGQGWVVWKIRGCNPGFRWNFHSSVMLNRARFADSFCIQFVNTGPLLSKTRAF